MKKILFTLPVLFLLALIFPKETLAVCPVCTVAVAGGLGLSRYLGIDDAVSGVWVGGLILSSSFWLDSWLEKKKIKFNYRIFVVISAMYALVIVPLWYGKVIGHPFNALWGIDKLIVGIAFGTLAFLLGVYLDRKERAIKEKQLFIYQRVVFPVTTLLTASLILYFLTK